ncbi:hypothetical protein CR513_61893, partial [Mucuna pruriens]
NESWGLETDTALIKSLSDSRALIICDFQINASVSLTARGTVTILGRTASPLCRYGATAMLPILDHSQAIPLSWFLHSPLEPSFQSTPGAQLVSFLVYCLWPSCSLFFVHRARVMDLQKSADKDWNEDIFVELDSEFAFAFNFAIDSAEKWKILSLNNGASKL